MNYTKTRQLIALAEELDQKIDHTQIFQGNKPSLNELFEAQREFGRGFNSQMRAILHELDGDVFTLKQRQFDPNMMRLLIKVKGDLEHILPRIRESNPHEAAQRLVDYVEGRNTGPVLDNLDFLIQHHLKATQEDVPNMPSLKNAEVNAIQKLKKLAQELKTYMDLNPSLPVPGSSPPPPRENPATQHPDMPIGPEAVTKG